jgi:hypothetical protein
VTHESMKAKTACTVSTDTFNGTNK